MRISMMKHSPRIEKQQTQKRNLRSQGVTDLSCILLRCFSLLFLTSASEFGFTVLK